MQTFLEEFLGENAYFKKSADFFEKMQTFL